MQQKINEWIPFKPEMHLTPCSTKAETVQCDQLGHCPWESTSMGWILVIAPWSVTGILSVWICRVLSDSCSYGAEKIAASGSVHKTGLQSITPQQMVILLVFHLPCQVDAKIIKTKDPELAMCWSWLLSASSAPLFSVSNLANRLMES